MNLDLELLKKQKLILVELLMRYDKTVAPTELAPNEHEAIEGIVNLLDAVQDEQEDKFPNGLSNWIETHHEIVSAIALNPEDAHNKVNDIEATKGTGGLYEFAEALTDKFEQEHKGVEWDGEWFNAIDEFLTNEFKD